MAISETVDVIESALWPQGDIRDPIGVWGARLGVTGDATGDSVKVGIKVAAGKEGAYVYTCYSVNIAVLTQATPIDSFGKVRLLTAWPNVDPLAGVQAYGSARIVRVATNALTAPLGAITDNQTISPAERFLLLFDPRQGAAAPVIVELEYESNTNLDTYSFEAYGYFWDRSVLNAPGGPRHPGSS